MRPFGLPQPPSARSMTMMTMRKIDIAVIEAVEGDLREPDHRSEVERLLRMAYDQNGHARCAA